MKTFDELATEEILALTDSEIERYINLECARSGVPLLPPEPGPGPEKPTTEKDVTLYAVGSFEFREQEAALRIADAINAERPVATKYASGPSYQRIIDGPADAASVTANTYYSCERWAEVGSELLAYEEAHRRWEAERDEYTKAVKARDGAAEWIWNRIGEVREEERQRRRTVALLERYVELADGDEAVARKFLLDVEPEAAKYLPAATVPEDHPDAPVAGATEEQEAGT